MFRSYDTVFPFVAIIGQDDIKKALILNIINPNIGGVLISGEKGTAKSTLVRGLNNIIEDMKIVEIPLNVTEDRLSGSVNLEYAIKEGKRKFEAGILKKADGNILYIDEVNLLSDNITKNLLEVCASGENIVEREGISFSHSSKFILVGSMNPEEGELRPQFLDRFGLYVEAKGEEDIRKRTKITKRRIEYETSPMLFINKYNEESEKLKLDIKRAKYALNKVKVSKNSMNLAVTIAKEANCEGHRAEITIIETARAIAALDGRVALNVLDIKEAARFVLPHRIIQKQEDDYSNPNKNDMDENEQDRDDSQDKNQEDNNQEANEDENNVGNNEDSSEYEENDNNFDNEEMNNDGEANSDYEDKNKEELNPPIDEVLEEIGEEFKVTKWLFDKNKSVINKGSGKRSLVKTSLKQGRYVKYSYPIKDKISDIAIDATLRAASIHQQKRDKKGKMIAIEKSDIRVKVRERRTGNTIIFVVDASGSMGANKRMKSVKGAILSLLNDAYQKRDKVGMIAFRNNSAEMILGITRSVDLAQKKLQELPVGGRTPLALGLEMAYDIVKASKIKDKDMIPVIVLVSDGRATYSSKGINPYEDAIQVAKKIGLENIKTVVIDAEESFIKLNFSQNIAKEMNANLFKIEDLHSDSIVTAVKLSL